MLDATSGEEATSSAQAPNYIYYYRVGLGRWAGDFTFNIVSWIRFWADPIGTKNRLLVIGMIAIMRLFGRARITSHLADDPGQSAPRTVVNLIRISKFGISLYTLNERYILGLDGRHVRVVSRERFGPIVFLLNGSKEYPATILASGMQSIYYMPLLGTNWIAKYRVANDRMTIEGRLRCSWAEAGELISKVA